MNAAVWWRTPVRAVVNAGLPDGLIISAVRMFPGRPPLPYIFRPLSAAPGLRAVWLRRQAAIRARRGHAPWPGPRCHEPHHEPRAPARQTRALSIDLLCVGWCVPVAHMTRRWMWRTRALRSPTPGWRMAARLPLVALRLVHWSWTSAGAGQRSRIGLLAKSGDDGRLRMAARCGALSKDCAGLRDRPATARPVFGNPPGTRRGCL
jgi:hypothetical protein